MEISDIILTHWHHDHVDGLPSVLALLKNKPRIWKYSEPNHLLPIEDLQELREGSEIKCADGAIIKVIHTPGHTVDSVALLIEGEGLFTADTVLGQGTSVFEDLAAYMASLRKLETVLEAEKKAGRSVIVYPAHGPASRRWFGDSSGIFKSIDK